MQYLLAIYEDERNYGGRDTEAWNNIVNAHMQIAGEMAQAGILRGGAGLEPTSTATTVRTRGGVQQTHDGPYTEVREQLGGFYLIDVPSLDVAIAWAKRIPLHADGAIEIRATLPDQD